MENKPKRLGRPPKPPETKYRGKYVKFPPEIIKWLADKNNIDNQNGFIVEAVREKIANK